MPAIKNNKKQQETTRKQLKKNAINFSRLKTAL
jgi:ribosomal protein S20